MTTPAPATTATTAAPDADRLRTAVAAYYERRDRRAHPDGDFDTAGRFTPATSEWRDCCTAIRSPSRNYPYSYMLHCRTVVHVAALYDVDVAALRHAIRPPRQTAAPTVPNVASIVAVSPAHDPEVQPAAPVAERTDVGPALEIEGLW